MNRMILGVFQERVDAEGAIGELEDLGYNPKDISILMKDKEVAKDMADDTGADVAGGAVSGATTGTIIGALAGLLVGAGIIPGLGAFLIGGPLAAALGLTGAAASTVSGAATGALAGGLIGALTGLGLSDDDAREYEKSLKAGGILLAIPARLGEEMEVRDILQDYGADQIKDVSMESHTTSMRDDKYTGEARPAFFSEVSPRKRSRKRVD